MTIVHWPSWFYGPHGQSAVFAGPLEVPEGWHDTPNKFGEDGEALEDAETEIPGYAEAVANAEDSDESEDEEAETFPTYNDITVVELKAYLDKNDVAYEADDNKTALYEAASAHFAEEEGDD